MPVETHLALRSQPVRQQGHRCCSQECVPHGSLQNLQPLHAHCQGWHSPQQDIHVPALHLHPASLPPPAAFPHFWKSKYMLRLTMQAPAPMQAQSLVCSLLQGLSFRLDQVITCLKNNRIKSHNTNFDSLQLLQGTTSPMYAPPKYMPIVLPLKNGIRQAEIRTWRHPVYCSFAGLPALCPSAI
jgi:hypothetical protein